MFGSIIAKHTPLLKGEVIKPKKIAAPQGHTTLEYTSFLFYFFKSKLALDQVQRPQDVQLSSFSQVNRHVEVQWKQKKKCN